MSSISKLKNYAEDTLQNISISNNEELYNLAEKVLIRLDLDLDLETVANIIKQYVDLSDFEDEIYESENEDDENLIDLEGEELIDMDEIEKDFDDLHSDKDDEEESETEEEEIESEEIEKDFDNEESEDEETEKDFDYDESKDLNPSDEESEEDEKDFDFGKEYDDENIDIEIDLDNLMSSETVAFDTYIKRLQLINELSLDILDLIKDEPKIENWVENKIVIIKSNLQDIYDYLYTVEK